MNDSVGKLILRLVLGVAILLHGIAKLTGGIGGIAGMVAGAGLRRSSRMACTSARWSGNPAAARLVLAHRRRAHRDQMLFAIGLAHRAEIFALNNRAAGRSSCRRCSCSPRSPSRSWARDATA